MAVRETCRTCVDGAVDRAALRRHQDPVVRGASSGLRRGDVERRLAELWNLMLGIDSVGRR